MTESVRGRDDPKQGEEARLGCGTRNHAVACVSACARTQAADGRASAQQHRSLGLR